MKALQYFQQQCIILVIMKNTSEEGKSAYMEYQVGTKQLIKQINQTAILKVIREHEPISRADIAKILKLTSATVSSNIAELMEKGLVREIGTGESNGGRRPVLLTIDKEKTAIIGVDVHKTSVSCGLVNLAGVVLQSCAQEFSNPNGHYELDVLTCIEKVIKKNQNRVILGIGVGMCGIIDLNRCISLFVPASRTLVNFDLKAYLEENTGFEVHLDNDANAMAVGERWFGAARTAKNCLFLNIGQGIGSGILIDGEIYRGSGFAAGEIGHVRVQENGRKCVCGKRGCLDTVATEYSMLNQLREEIEKGRDTLLKTKKDSLDIEGVLEAAESGDELTISVLSKIGTYIGRAVSYAVNILNPDLVIFGGSMSKLGDFILKPLKEEAVRLCMYESGKNTEFVLSELADDAGVVGAAALYIQEIIGY